MRFNNIEKLLISLKIKQNMNKNLLIIVIAITSILYSCTEVDEPLIDNPYDPEYVSDTKPLARISSSISDGEEINTTDASFSWTGTGGSSSEFTYMLEGVDDDFRSWSSSKTVNYSYLDEGEYTFLVLERLANKAEQESATSIKFTVNAINNFGLVLEKYAVEAPSGSDISINLNVEEADDLSGLTTIITYDDSRLTFENATKASAVNGIDDIGVLYKVLSPGQLELNVLLLGTNNGFSGNATLCKLNFSSNSDRGSTISFDESNTVLRDENNRDLTITTFREANIN